MAHDRHAHAAGLPGQDRASFGRPLVVALAISGVFLVVEVAGALLTGSLALLADAGHMLTDVGALALALFAVWIGSRPATARRTYGFYRVEVLAALANAASLVAVALYVFWEAYERLWAPPPVQALPMLGVAAAGLAANAASAWVLGHHAGENINVRAAFLHVLGDMLGSVGALVAAVVILTTGWFYADPLASVLIGLFVLWSGWRLLAESVDVLLEATPKGVDLGEVERALLGVPGVSGLHDLHAWTVTSGFLALSGHLTVRDADHGQVLVMATEVLRERFGIGHATLQLEASALEERVHHGCYVGGDASACAVPFGAPTRTVAGHRH